MSDVMMWVGIIIASQIAGQLAAGWVGYQLAIRSTLRKVRRALKATETSEERRKRVMDTPLP